MQPRSARSGAAGAALIRHRLPAIVGANPVVAFPPAPAAVNGRAFKGATRRGSGPAAGRRT